LLVFADVLHAERRLAAMHNIVIGEGSHAFVILEGPALEVVARRFFEI